MVKKIRTLRRSRLNASDRAVLRELSADALALRDDYFNRRFRNALNALMENDSNWIMFVQDNLPPRMEKFTRAHLQLLEIRARAFTLKSYNGIFARWQISAILFNPNMPFNERGALIQT